MTYTLLAELESWLWSGTVTPRVTPKVVAECVNELSDLYTVERGLLARQQGSRDHLVAKILYFLASDAPKIALALDECSQRDEAFRSPTRILDLGCGVGATSVGFLLWRAQQRAMPAESIEIVGVDHAPAALAMWPAIVRRAAALAGIDVQLRTEHADLAGAALASGTDLVLCQTTLNERLPGGTAREQTYDAATVDLVRRWALAAPLLLVEPALRATTRPLHRLRDTLLERGGVRVVAPCPHAHRCPMLARESDWCHESRVVQPTPMVAAVQELTRRRDARALFSFVAFAPGDQAHDRAPMRFVSDALGSRGKTERWVCCGDGRLRVLRVLDREQRAGNSLLATAERGTLVRIEPEATSDRIGPEQRVISCLARPLSPASDEAQAAES